jgi:hypothetical protein
MSVGRFWLAIVGTLCALFALTAAIVPTVGSDALGITAMVVGTVALTLAVARTLRHRDGAARFDEWDVALVTCFSFGSIVFFVWVAVAFETFWIVFIPAVPLALSISRYVDLRTGRARRAR